MWSINRKNLKGLSYKLELSYIFILIFESDLVNKVETMVGSNLLLS